MFSTLIELGGFACLVEGVNALAGQGFAFLVAGLLLALIGVTMDDDAIAVASRRFIRSVTAPARRRRLNAAADRSPHPPLEIDPMAEEFADEAARAHERRIRAVR